MVMPLLCYVLRVGQVNLRDEYHPVLIGDIVANDERQTSHAAHDFESLSIGTNVQVCV